MIENCELPYVLKFSSMAVVWTTVHLDWAALGTRKHPSVVRQYETGLWESCNHVSQKNIILPFAFFIKKNNLQEKPS